MKEASLQKNDETVIAHVELARSFAERSKGLLGRTRLPSGHAMHLSPCASVHTFFMRFPIDLAFLDRELTVVKVVRDVCPWRMVFGGKGAHSVLEVESGWLPADALQPGDPVQMETENG